MRFYAETLGLSDTAFILLRDLVHERIGLYFEGDKCDQLADKLSPLVIERGFDSFLDYYYFLKYDPAAAAEWPRVMNALAVPETFFWREMDAVTALVQRIVPDFSQAHPGEHLRIWSAACASGEEPLSLAMALNEEGWFERAPIEIIGSDASPLAIEKAQRGLYRERSFRSLPPELRTKYFTETPEGWQVDRRLQARIKYAVANLTDPIDVAPLARVSVIFCRNVFIYFSEQSIRKVVRSFSEGMRTPGYLFVGASESLLRLTTDLQLEEIGGAFVYVKR